MRTEVILLCLFIIFTSSFTSFINNYVYVVPPLVLLDTVSGSVGQGNFTYWKLTHKGPLIIELTSEVGDADLYISEQERPGYEVDQNSFNSATCGVDQVFIPEDFPRPLGIGVFGHHPELSYYELNIYIDTEIANENIQLFMELQAEVANHERMDRLNQFDEVEKVPRSNFKTSKNGEEKKEGGIIYKWKKTSKLLGLSLLDMILEMFV